MWPQNENRLPSWGSRENGKEKLSILSINIWGDRFYQPLQMGHQNFSGACGAHQLLHIGLYYGRDHLNILAPGRRGGGGLT